MKNKTIIVSSLSVVLLAFCTLSGLHYISRLQTCASDNRAYRSVLKNWGKTNVIELSMALSRLQKDSCKV